MKGVAFGETTRPVLDHTEWKASIRMDTPQRSGGSGPEISTGGFQHWWHRFWSEWKARRELRRYRQRPPSHWVERRVR